jgi:hypothetical protein
MRRTVAVEGSTYAGTSRRPVANTHASAPALAASSFSLLGGQTKVVQLHLSRRTRRLLAREHRLSVVIAIIPRGSAAAGEVTETPVTLRPRK